MSDFIFRINPNIIIGPYTVSRLGQQLKDYGKRFFVVMDPILKEVKLSDKILQSLNEHKIESIIFSELNEGTSTKAIARALTLAKQGHVHGVIAIGGVKALSIGRAVAAYYNEIHDLYTFVGGANPNTSSIPCICVPTTYRAPFAFTNEIPVSDSRNHQLKALKVQNNVTKLMLIDPNLMLSLTDNQKATLALEMLGMAIEAYISQKANFFSDMFVEKGVEILSIALEGSPSIDITTPEEVLLAQAGTMISLATTSSSLGLGTLISLSVYSHYGISKSLTSSVILPFAIDDAVKFKSQRLEKLAHIMKIVPESTTGEEAAKSLSEYARQKIAKSNLPTRLKDLKLSVEQLSLAIEDLSSLDMINQLPKSMSNDEIFDFVKQAF